MEKLNREIHGAQFTIKPDLGFLESEDSSQNNGEFRTQNLDKILNLNFGVSKKYCQKILY